MQKHSVFEPQTRTEGLFCAKTPCFWAVNQSWGFILCKHTVFLRCKPELRVHFVQKHCVLSCKPELRVHFVQKHSVFRIWTRVEGLFCAKTQCFLNANQTWGFILCKNTVFLKSKPELRVYFVQTHIVFELQTRLEGLFCAKTQCFWHMNQSWGFILCKNTVFLRYEPELTVYFVQKRSVFRKWTRVEGLFCAKTQGVLRVLNFLPLGPITPFLALGIKYIIEEEFRV